MTARAKARRDALEEAGLVRLPTLWVYPEEAAMIYQIAKRHKATVHAINKALRKKTYETPVKHKNS